MGTVLPNHLILMVTTKMVKTEKIGYSEIQIFIISFIAILAFLLVGVGLYQHYQVQGMEEYDKVNITGQYILTGYDQHYQTYLEALGVSKHTVYKILSTPESIEFSVSGDEQNIIRQKTVTKFISREIQFTLCTQFFMSYGKGVLDSFCTKPEHNIIHCRASDKAASWEFMFDLVFEKEKMISKRTFLTKRVEMKKFYRKV